MERNIQTVTNQPLRILLPVVGIRSAQSLISVGRALLAAGADDIVLAGIVGIDEEQPLSAGAFRAQRRRQDINNLVDRYADLSLKSDPHVRVTYDPVAELVNLVAEHNCDIVLLRLTNNAQLTLGRPVDTLLARLPCQAILQRGNLPTTPSEILLAARGAEHSTNAVSVLAALAKSFDTDIGLVRVTGTRRALESRRADESYLELLEMVPYAREISIRGSFVDLIDTLRVEMDRNSVLVIGTEAREAVRGRLGSRTRAIMDAVQGPIIAVYMPVDHRRRIREPEPLPLSLAVDKWFAENTFDAEEFSDLERLVALKEAQGVTISLGLPALNEEATIGNVITTVRDVLMVDYPLLDEIVVVDSMSTDKTVEIAESLGVSVYRHPEILPEQGSYVGKGEALWKSLHVLKGDIIAWIDTDIVNIHPRFVYGLLGPLLVSQKVQYVKGFYRRPLRVGDKVQAGGGGRVTELVARPMLNLFFPELSGIVQPLSGEYAGRREVLERLPFFTTYAVETGLLIDILNQYGLSSIAQVDLKERIHHNQPLVALSLMSFVIVQAIFERLDEHRIINLFDEPSRSMKLIADTDGELSLDIEELPNLERPPMITVAGYRARQKAEPAPPPHVGRLGSVDGEGVETS